MQIVFDPVGLLTCIMLILNIERRVTREEEELAKTFGKEWTEYASTTKRFIPSMI